MRLGRHHAADAAHDVPFALGGLLLQGLLFWYGDYCYVVAAQMFKQMNASADLGWRIRPATALTTLYALVPVAVCLVEAGYDRRLPSRSEFIPALLAFLTVYAVMLGRQAPE